MDFTKIYQNMSLQQLEYANVKRSEVDISSVTGPCVVKTSARTGRSLPDHPPTLADLAEEVTGDTNMEPRKIPVPSAAGHNWVFSGHLNNEALFDLIEYYGVGYDRIGNQTTDETSDRLTAMAKKKRGGEGKAPSRRQKREAKARMEHLDRSPSLGSTT